MTVRRNIYTYIPTFFGGALNLYLGAPKRLCTPYRNWNAQPLQITRKEQEVSEKQWTLGRRSEYGLTYGAATASATMARRSEYGLTCGAATASATMARRSEYGLTCGAATTSATMAWTHLWGGYCLGDHGHQQQSSLHRCPAAMPRVGGLCPSPRHPAKALWPWRPTGLCC